MTRNECLSNTVFLIKILFSFSTWKLAVVPLVANNLEIFSRLLGLIGWASATFCTGLLSQPIAISEELSSLTQGLDRVDICSVLVAANYISNFAACTNMLNESIHGIISCNISLFGFFGAEGIWIALCGSWTSLVAFHYLLACATLTGGHWMICVLCSCLRSVETSLSRSSLSMASSRSQAALARKGPRHRASFYCMYLVRLGYIRFLCCSEKWLVKKNLVAGLDHGGHSYLAILISLVALLEGRHIDVAIGLRRAHTCFQFRSQYLRALLGIVVGRKSATWV